MDADDNTSESDSPDRLLSADDLSRAFAQLMSDGPEVVDEDSTPQKANNEEQDESFVLDDQADNESQTEFPISPKAIIEGALFVGHPKNEPLTSRLLASLMRGVSPSEVDDLVVELNGEYLTQSSPYRIESAGAGYRMVLAEEFSSIRENFYGKVRHAQLSQGAVDIMAIVGYHQPIERQRIDDLRGKPSGGVLSQLVRRQLLQVEITNERPRRFIYRTTDRFLELFGLESIRDLPHGDGFVAD